LREYTNDTLVKYPIIIPLIKSSGISVTINKSLNLDYPTSSAMRRQLASSTKTANLTCLSKMSTGWNTSNCYQEYSAKHQLFSCHCEEALPTTIADDLENLIINKNLQTAFSSQGLSNISNWTNFYCYIAFWLLLTKTTALVYLLIKGRKLDLINTTAGGASLSTKVTPILSDKVINSENSNEKIVKP